MGSQATKASTVRQQRLDEQAGLTLDCPTSHVCNRGRTHYSTDTYAASYWTSRLQLKLAELDCRFVTFAPPGQKTCKTICKTKNTTTKKKQKKNKHHIGHRISTICEMGRKRVIFAADHIF